MSGLVVIDVETTGLKPGFILEVAAVVLDMNLQEKGRFHTIVKPPDFTVELASDFYVLEMHTKNNLWNEVATGTPENEACSAFCKFLEEARAKLDAPLYFMGNSIAGLDLPFLRARMPQVFDYMHYRSIDVSGLQLALEIAHGKTLEVPKPESKHRAMADVEQCIRQFKFLSEYMGGHMIP